MIIDAHTHIIGREHITEKAKQEKIRGVSNPVALWLSEPETHYAATKRADKVIVLGLYAPFSGIVVPNDYVAEYIQKDPQRLIGFMSVDPHDSGCVREIERSQRELGLKGIKLGPIYQDFDPSDRELAYPVYEKASELNLPIMFHMGTTFTRDSKLKYSQPILLEDVAHDFPDLKMVIAHLGHPWEADTIVLIRKQPNVFADISALYYRPWQLYNSLRLATEYQVMDKLIFGTDFPFTTLEDSLTGLNKICELAEKANLPPIEKADINAIVHRDTMKMLGIDN